MIFNFFKKNKLLILTDLLAMVIYFVGLLVNNYNVCLISTIIALIFNIVESYINKRSGYLYFILFHLFLFLFIFSRPIISMIRQDEWWYFSSYTVYVVIFVLLITLISLKIGFNIKTNLKASDLNVKIRGYNLSKLKRPLFFICTFLILMSFIQGVIKYLYFSDDYVAIYTGQSADVPVIIAVLASLTIYFLIFYLSLLPTKKDTSIILVLYLISSIPEFLIGGRNTLMIKCLFCFVYFVLREFQNRKENWITKRDKIAIVIIIPILVLGLGVMNYTREDKSVPNFSPIELAVDFLYKQGTTFDTICQSVEYRSELRDDSYINYTFGEPIDMVVHNNLSNFLFGTVDLGDGNNIKNGTISNNLAHRLSYLVLGDSYLSGHGRGTSYLAEIYLDFGYLGIIVFNILLGKLFSIVDYLFNKDVLHRCLLLNVFMYIYIIPRLAFFSIFSFAINYYFWISCILILLMIILKSDRFRRMVNNV